MKNQQDNFPSLSALLCAADSVDTLETNSLCCAAAGIIAPPSATAKALIPHVKLRGAALWDATLTAQKRSLAQPAEEGKKALTLTINFAKKPVFLTEVLKVSMDDAEDVSNRQSIHAIGNAPAHLRETGLNQHPPSVRTMSHDSRLWRGKL